MPGVPQLCLRARVQLALPSAAQHAADGRQKGPFGRFTGRLDGFGFRISEIAEIGCFRFRIYVKSVSGNVGYGFEYPLGWFQICAKCLKTPTLSKKNFQKLFKILVYIKFQNL